MTSKLTLPIEIGRRYVRRDGRVEEATDTPCNASFAQTSGGFVLRKTGRNAVGYEQPFDLVADAPEEPITYAITDYADVLRAIADGREIQLKTIHETWVARDADIVLQWVRYMSIPPNQLRIKPDTITINGREVPAPVRVALEPGRFYWLVDIGGQRCAQWLEWDGGKADKDYLSRGLIHLTESAAREHAEALLSFTQQEAE